MADFSSEGKLDGIDSFEHHGEVLKWKITFHYQDRQFPGIVDISSEPHQRGLGDGCLGSHAAGRRLGQVANNHIGQLPTRVAPVAVSVENQPLHLNRDPARSDIGKLLRQGVRP